MSVDTTFSLAALNPKRGEVRPNEASERPSRLCKVRSPQSGSRWLIHCHGVEYRGGFAVFWVVEKGLKREIWATNQRLEVKDLPEATTPKEYWPVDFGFYRMPHNIDEDVFQTEDRYRAGFEVERERRAQEENQ